MTASSPPWASLAAPPQGKADDLSNARQQLDAWRARACARLESGLPALADEDLEPNEIPEIVHSYLAVMLAFAASAEHVHDLFDRVSLGDDTLSRFMAGVRGAVQGFFRDHTGKVHPIYNDDETKASGGLTLDETNPESWDRDQSGNLRYNPKPNANQPSTPTTLEGRTKALLDKAERDLKFRKLMLGYAEQRAQWQAEQSKLPLLQQPLGHALHAMVDAITQFDADSVRKRLHEEMDRRFPGALSKRAVKLAKQGSDFDSRDHPWKTHYEEPFQSVDEAAQWAQENDITLDIHASVDGDVVRHHVGALKDTLESFRKVTSPEVFEEIRPKALVFDAEANRPSVVGHYAAGKLVVNPNQLERMQKLEQSDSQDARRGAQGIYAVPGWRGVYSREMAMNLWSKLPDAHQESYRLFWSTMTANSKNGDRYPSLSFEASSLDGFAESVSRMLAGGPQDPVIGGYADYLVRAARGATPEDADAAADALGETMKTHPRNRLNQKLAEARANYHTPKDPGPEATPEDVDQATGEFAKAMVPTPEPPADPATVADFDQALRNTG